MIVFCTTNKNRTQHLRLTLPRNLADNADHADCKFVVLDYNSADDLLAYLKSCHSADIAGDRLVVYSMLPPDGVHVPFHMAHAKNMAHRCGILEGGDILVNLDADGFPGPGFASFISEKFSDAADRRIFMQAMWNRWVRRGGKPKWMSQDPRGEFGPPVPKGSNGRMVVTKGEFLLAGGYNEKYDTWSPDDKDLNMRLRRLGCEPELLERRFQETVLHNDKVRFREYPHAEVFKNGYDFKITVHSSDETIANFGKVGMGTVYRNFDFSRPIVLGPIPTRIFGVGLHKTATFSLHEALGILGHDSAHWPSAHWARAVWREMTQKGKSATVEKSYALSDLPISVLYLHLDRAYPGSKFILTVRDEAKWIDSVRGHWSYEHNPFRSAWDGDPFSHFIHRKIYGREDFDAEVFLERYRRHNSEVREYFRSRPGDFLEFNVDAGHGWDEICRFLGDPIPNLPFPRRNSRSSPPASPADSRADES